MAPSSSQFVALSNIAEKFAAVLVIVAIKTEILPVGAIREIIPMIAILVVHR